MSAGKRARYAGVMNIRRKPFRLRRGTWRDRAAAVLALIGLAALAEAADPAESYAVEVSATVQSNPARITLAWAAVPGVVNTYSVFRKDPGATSWTALINLQGTATTYADSDVTVGRVYEYQVVRRAPTLTGYGYVAASIERPVVDDRGKVVLVVDQTIAGPLATELDQLAQDLIGDGWMVARHDVGRTDTPTAVRDVIRAEYNADPAHTNAVLLFGHVPVAMAGNLNIDGHGSRPLPADAFYGDMDGNWTDANGDGVFDQNEIPSDIELMVGRVDFADLPGAQASASFPSETELLRRYLAKDHAYRLGTRRVTPRALLGDRFEDFGGEAFAASGFRNFAALLGPGGIQVANTADNAPVAERWISLLAAADYQWVYGAGGGTVNSMSGLGGHGAFNDVWSSDLVGQGARGTFYLMFGSWLVDWSQSDDIMRAALAAPDYGLAAAWAGRPHLFFQHMAVGEPIGYGIRLSQNNRSLYTNQVNNDTRGIHVALLGDPTLRLQVVRPPGSLTIAPGGGAPALSWAASADAAAGYHVYRSASATGPFTRVTTSPVNSTVYTDLSAPAGSFTYMVRAVRLDVSGSASYYNLSQGVLANATVTTPATGGSSGDNGGGNPLGAGGNGSAPASGGGALEMWFLAALALAPMVRCCRAGSPYPAK
ncbi:MAG TPA: hypothetical protein VG936_05400 [Lacunisphaera sp.]|nr:hypothetical protein [Lacunisphaera sp.]